MLLFSFRPARAPPLLCFNPCTTFSFGFLFHRDAFFANVAEPPPCWGVLSPCETRLVYFTLFLSNIRLRAAAERPPMVHTVVVFMRAACTSFRFR